MPFKTVLVKGLGKIKFPSRMSESAIAAAIAPLSLYSEDSEPAFLGKMAKNASLDMLGMARKMEHAGVDPSDIWRKTGWGRGADNKWRFEIDDSAASLKGVDFMPEIRKAALDGDMEKVNRLSKEQFEYDQPFEREKTTLNSVVDHRELFSNYPISTTGTQSIKWVGYKRDKKLPLGEAYYTPSSDSITLSTVNRENTISPLMHEVQHAIQEREGFAKGADPSYIRRKLSDYAFYNEVDSLREFIDYADGEISTPSLRREFKLFYGYEPSLDAIRVARNSDPKEVKTKLNKLRDYFENKTPESVYPEDFYNRTAGEVEARNVQKRLNMDWKERRNNPPWETEDVPRNKQIIASVAPALSVTPFIGAKKVEANPLTQSVTGAIQAPKHPRIAKVSELIDKHDDILMDDLLGGVTSYLDKLAYEDKITFKDRIMAALDLI